MSVFFVQLKVKNQRVIDINYMKELNNGRKFSLIYYCHHLIITPYKEILRVSVNNADIQKYVFKQLLKYQNKTLRVLETLFCLKSCLESNSIGKGLVCLRSWNIIYRVLYLTLTLKSSSNFKWHFPYILFCISGKLYRAECSCLTNINSSLQGLIIPENSFSISQNEDS